MTIFSTFPTVSYMPEVTWTTTGFPLVGNASLWPTTCGVNLHVWACDHMARCQCGVATREVVRAVCQTCGT